MTVDSHILWHNDDYTIVVLDGPGSIRDAQGLSLSYKLVSTAPLDKPWPSQEPKTQAARERLLNSNPSSGLYSEYAKLLDEATSQAHALHGGPWTLRSITEVMSIPTNSFSDALRSRQTDGLQIELSGGRKIDNHSQLDTWPYFSNELNEAVHLLINDGSADRFLLPSRTTFMLADCADPRQIENFHSNVRHQASEADTKWRFDFILLDPPWSNRSAKRKRSSYQTTDIPQIANMLSAMDLDRLMSKDCLIGVWITNKASAREAVLAEDGIFQSWGVDLIEEWIWLKITTHGVPIGSLDALWRKPYEILLLGRRKEISGRAEARPSISRRVLMSVPDLHSRKPCLKRLLETMLLDKPDYRALEVFARHLVEGWWSWGNECIKFNDLRHWRCSDKSRDQGVMSGGI